MSKIVMCMNMRGAAAQYQTEPAPTSAQRGLPTPREGQLMGRAAGSEEGLRRGRV